MSMKRIITLFRKELLSITNLLFAIPIFSFLIIGLSFRFAFAANGEFDRFSLPLVMDAAPLIIGVAAGFGVIEALQLEKNKRTAEMLFSTPVTTREYMFSLWLKGVVISTLVIYLAMGIFALSLGIERVAAHVSPLVWMQPPLLIIAFVSGSGLSASIMLWDSSSIKKLFYFVIVFAPIAVVVTLVIIMLITGFIGLIDHPEHLPTWVSWLLETLQVVREIMPPFIYSPWARWLPVSIYMFVWFFILSKKLHIGEFIRPFASWRSAFVPW
ncbi:MAG: hypothetical protein DDT32_01947 [Syntrophomonadaceae bacterium]|nr:hypothetical protein [Bacillota bacterium]MBT9148177.1 hypothetical protein [Bacillota bacterium]